MKIEKSEFTTYYLNDNKQYIEKILQTGASLEKVSDELKAFIRNFYKYFPLNEVSEAEYNNIYLAAKDAYKFVGSKDVSLPKIRVFNPTKNENGWETNHTIVEILTNDAPFIVDSVTKGIDTAKYKTYRLVHPVINAERDESGNLIKLHTESSEGAKAESMLHLHISQINYKEDLAKLEESLRLILEKVHLATGEWAMMLKKSKQCLEDIKNISSQDQKVKEAASFLEWLSNDNYIFLSCLDFESSVDAKFDPESIKEADMLGVVKSSDNLLKQKIFEDILNYSCSSKNYKDENLVLEIGKINKISSIHRRANLDYVLFSLVNKKTSTVKTYVFVGLFTSVIYYQSVTLIPIIRQKIEAVMDGSGFGRKSHNSKELLTILESMPRDEVLQSTEEELFNNAMQIFGLLSRPKVKLLTRISQSGKLFYGMVMLPDERYSAEKTEELLELFQEDFGGTITSTFKQLTDSHLCYLYITINNVKKSVSVEKLIEIEKKIDEITNLWTENLQDELHKEFPSSEAEKLYNFYADGFTSSYTQEFTANTAVSDISYLEKCYSQEKILFNIYKNSEEEGLIDLKIYSAERAIRISEIMPMLDNMGFSAVDESTFEISRGKKHVNLWIHYFRLSLKSDEDISRLKTNIEDAMDQIWSGNLSNDGFNKLILAASLNYREVAFVRTLCKYIRQTRITYSQHFMEEALFRYNKLAKLLVKFIYLKFDPDFVGDKDAQLEDLNNQVAQELLLVKTLADDVVIRRFFDVARAILRTNFFQLSNEGVSKAYISIKLDSSKVPELPKPVPYAEIFVYSPLVEGIHLRGGKVARGGLRWSDRTEDFRTEVLGLVKAQMTKNTIIVPVGSKGGFICKRIAAGIERDAYMKEVVERYKTFLRGLLDLTDNIVDGKIVPPKMVARLDADDPYLVVAADKGTATFSDIANGVSEEYGFWLGDAFASGGSVGYDHKKMAITARGGWVCVERHFLEMGKSTHKDDFTVIGIGDMSGDVFGNGMLCSKHIRLVGAFNHMHIFIDPNPDTTKSFAERQRLFNLPRSTWADYDKSILSKGAQIYERSAKVLELTPEIKELLEIKKDSVTPDELMRILLTAKVDLLWNGGIGTYVKAEDEVNEHVGDKANDSLRVNGKDLNCFVVGEGGNLGFTQKGRIEYALNGGRLNTDFIDNSAGVDCSDHEVNIKIAFGKAIESKKITLEQRDKTLVDMTDEVADLVLRDNYLQTESISVSEYQGHSLLEMQSRLVNILEKEGLLDRKIEFLPSEQEFNRRMSSKQKLTRPELAVLLAYSKLSIYNHILESDLPDDDYFKDDLKSYFPELIRNNFEAEINSHALRREIIATTITNSTVNRVGSSFLHLAMEDTGLKGCDIARAYTIARDLFDLRFMWKDIEELDGKIAIESQLMLFLDVKKLVQRVTSWLLRNGTHPLNIKEIMTRFKGGVVQMTENIETMFSGTQLEDYHKKIEKYQSMNIPLELAKKVAAINIMSSACDIIEISSEYKIPLENVAKTFFEVESRFNFGWLQNSMENLTSGNYWQRLSIKTLREDMFDKQRKLAALVSKEFGKEQGSVQKWCEKYEKEVTRFDTFINDLRTHEAADFSMMVIAAKRMDRLFI